LENYVASRAGEEKVAGRSTVMIDLRPKSRNGRWKRFWIDDEKWVILASEDCKGPKEAVRSIRYTQVEDLKPEQGPGPGAVRAGGIPDPSVWNGATRGDRSAVSARPGAGAVEVDRLSDPPAHLAAGGLRARRGLPDALHLLAPAPGRPAGVHGRPEPHQPL